MRFMAHTKEMDCLLTYKPLAWLPGRGQVRDFLQVFILSDPSEFAELKKLTGANSFVYSVNIILESFLLLAPNSNPYTSVLFLLSSVSK